MGIWCLTSLVVLAYYFHQETTTGVHAFETKGSGISRRHDWQVTRFSQKSSFVGTPCLKDCNQRRLVGHLCLAKTNAEDNDSINVQINEFFKKPVPLPIQEALSPALSSYRKKDNDFISLATAAPSDPGAPRPLWLVILASVPTGLVWYGYYKFCVEEELLYMDLKEEARGGGKQDKTLTLRGFGGYGTLGPFVYLCLFGPVATILHFPGGMQWTTLGICFIYYTQFLLYARVNELYKQEGSEEPLSLWWCLPIFFPFDLIVGLRQVHFLSQYWYRKRGVNPPPNDPVVDFFPFIGAKRFTWQEFLLTPSLWCSLLANVDKINRKALPEAVQKILVIGEDGSTSSRK